MRKQALWLILAVLTLRPALAQEPPYGITPNLFDFSRPADLGLKPAPGAQTFTIFRARDNTDHYANGVVLMPFKGRLYAQWQSSARDEDSPDTWVAYAVSRDGEHWSAPRPLGPRAGTMRTSGGWWTDGRMLVAYINVWHGDPRSGEHTEYVSSADGRHWSQSQLVMDADGKPVDGVIEQDPHALPDGRIVTAFHLQPGLVVAPFYTDDPKGVSGWTRGVLKNLPHTGPESRELEPAWFRRADGCLVMVFRDQESTFRQLASQSCDRGASWTTPVLTDMPDSRAKQSAGNLPDCSVFLVNAPSGNKTRAPLVVTLGKDGRTFDRAFVLRAGGAALPSLRYPGKYKRPGYHYPKSVVWNGSLYVSYATNKEDAQLTRVRLP
jgi:hypothetical protein